MTFKYHFEVLRVLPGIREVQGVAGAQHAR